MISKKHFGVQKCFFCYQSNPKKFQISCHRTHLIRQKYFSFFKKCSKSKKNYNFLNAIYTISKNELKMMCLSRNTEVVDSFFPQKLEFNVCSI